MMKKRAPSIAAPAVNELDLLSLDLPLFDIEVDFPELDVKFPDVDVDAQPPARPAAPAVATVLNAMPSFTGKSVRTTIRLPRNIVEEFKHRAAAEGTCYQTLIVRALRDSLAPLPELRHGCDRQCA